MIYGVAITEDSKREEFELEGRDNVSDNEIWKACAKEAMVKRNDHHDPAMMRVNGMKEEWGSGVSTLVMIYNALGCPLAFRSSDDDSGHMWLSLIHI